MNAVLARAYIENCHLRAAGARFRCDSNPSKLLKTLGRILGVISFLREFPKSPNCKSL